jgi:phage head maturation protease
MAKTAAERQAEFRAKAKERGDERVNVVANADTVKRLRLFADFNEMTQAQALDRMIDLLWGTIPDAEVEAMERHAVTLEERRRAKAAGDEKTLSLF